MRFAKAVKRRWLKTKLLTSDFKKQKVLLSLTSEGRWLGEPLKHGAGGGGLHCVSMVERRWICESGRMHGHPGASMYQLWDLGQVTRTFFILVSFFGK